MPQPDLTQMELEELSRLFGAAGSTSPDAQRYAAEFTRRQTVAQINAAEAQVRAASAAEETAKYTRTNARYLLWSVVVLAVSGLGTFAVSIVNILLTTTAISD